MIERPNNILQALPHLHDGQWYTFTNVNKPTYASLKILDTNFSKPTKEQLETKLLELQEEYDNTISKKASVKKKLEDLGLTTDEIKEAFNL
jgi:hypothetical protein